MRRAGVAMLLAAAAGCGGAGSPPPAAIVVTPAMYGTDMSLRDVADGDAVDLVHPPQGGHVLFVGARVANLGERTVELRARLRDPSSDAVVAEDARSITLGTASDGRLEPDLRSYVNVANVTLCPQVGRAFDGQSFLLEVVVTELSSRRSGSARRLVVTACRQSDPTALDACRCQCGPGFMPGGCPR